MPTFGDIFVMDAFGTAHRAQASTHGVAQFAATACAGPLLSDELDNLAKALANPARPMVAIVGGSKVSTKTYCVRKPFRYLGSSDCWWRHSKYVFGGFRPACWSVII